MRYLPLIMLVPFAKLILDDFHRREVSVWWLAATMICAAGIPTVLYGWRETLARCGLNMLIVAYMGLGVVIWARIKSRKLVNPVNRYIGLGDVLFFVVLTPLFPFKRFAWLLVACMIFSLVWWWMARAGKKPPKNVPLVATSGIVMCAAIILDTIFK